MCIRGLSACGVTLVLACSSDQPPVARVAPPEVTFPDSPLARMQSASLIAAGDGFILAAYEAGQVRWARVSKDGVLSQETGFPLGKPVVGPAFAVTKKAAPADQLIAVAVVASASVPGGYDVQAIGQSLGAANTSSPVVLETLRAGTDKAKIRLTAGGATSGNAGFAVWGVQTPNVPVRYALLGPDAAVVGTGTAFDDRIATDPPAWDCLAATFPSSGLGFGVVGPDLTPAGAGLTDWATVELDEGGSIIGSMTNGFAARVSNCNIAGSSTASGGFDMAFAGQAGIGGAFYYPPAPGTDMGSVTAYPILISANAFGDPLNIPDVAWAAPAGDDMIIGLARRSGPYVVRFTYQAVPHGSPLMLRSANGNTGPVAAWVGPDYVYATYADQVVGSSGTVSVLRYFVKIAAPAQLP